MGIEAFYSWALRREDLAFDVGANVGEHTAAMLHSGARVVAIEPQARLAQELAQRFPSAEVVPCGLSDAAGEAKLMTVTGHTNLATLNPSWTKVIERVNFGGTLDGSETIRLTTLDQLITRFGVPSFIKIDTEGFDDRVLSGLSLPIPQQLFEISSEVPDVAIRAFEHLASLGRYDYRLSDLNSWNFGKRADPKEILQNAPLVGNVYARLRATNSAGTENRQPGDPVSDREGFLAMRSREEPPGIDTADAASLGPARREPSRPDAPRSWRK